MTGINVLCITRGEIDLIAVGPSDKKQIVRHLSPEGDTDPLVRDGSNNFANKFLSLWTCRCRWRKGETVIHTMCRLLETLPCNSIVDERCTALRKG